MMINLGVKTLEFFENYALTKQNHFPKFFSFFEFPKKMIFPKCFGNFLWRQNFITFDLKQIMIDFLWSIWGQKKGQP